MKKIIWRDKNHMVFESEHKTFNEQTQVISPGNVYANTQSSSYIRAYTETECNGFTRPPGHLQAFDLQYFKELSWYHATVGFKNIREEVEYLTRDKAGILYEFHHWYHGKKVIHGYILTDTEYNLIRAWCLNGSSKSWSIILEATKYVTTIMN